jgi:acetyltransferase-like isoleucine patch superfamily enzyme
MIERKDLPPKRKIGYNMGAAFLIAAKQSAIENRVKGPFATTRLLIRRFNRFIFSIVARHVPIPRLRVTLHRKRGVKIGKGVQIGPMVTLENPFPDAIYIDDFVAISNGATVLAHAKPPIIRNDRFESYINPVLIKKGAWLGINVTVLPGVDIGEYSVVTPGSVVTKNVPPYSIVRGNPAEVVSYTKKITSSKE